MMLVKENNLILRFETSIQEWIIVGRVNDNVIEWLSEKEIQKEKELHERVSI